MIFLQVCHTLPTILCMSNDLVCGCIIGICFYLQAKEATSHVPCKICRNLLEFMSKNLIIIILYANNLMIIYDAYYSQLTLASYLIKYNPIGVVYIQLSNIVQQYIVCNNIILLLNLHNIMFSYIENYVSYIRTYIPPLLVHSLKKASMLLI